MESRRARRPRSAPKKPQPEARGPNRAWSGAWSKTAGGEARAARPRASSRPADAKDTNGVSAGVALGYRVIQEYLRQGERVARSFWSPGDDADGYDPTRLVDRALRSAQDLAGAFSEMVRILAKNAAPSEEAAPPGGFDFDPPRRAKARGGDEPSEATPDRARADSAKPAPTVSVSVRSRRPVKVALQLNEAADPRVFQVPPLARSGKGAALLHGTTIATGAGGRGVTINLKVPPRLAKGRYQGLVLDARTSRPVGFLSVDVGA
jgi:hypothetical protein